MTTANISMVIVIYDIPAKSLISTQALNGTRIRVNTRDIVGPLMNSTNIVMATKNRK